MSRFLAVLSGVALFCTLDGHTFGRWYRERHGRKQWRRDCAFCDAKQRR